MLQTSTSSRPLSALFSILLLLLLVVHSASALAITSPFSMRGAVPFAIAAFGAPAVTTREQRSRIVVSDPFVGCEKFHNANQFKHKIVMISRGGCSFAVKARAAEAAGAIGAIMVQNDARATLEQERAETLFMMSDDGSGHEVGIPVVMITLKDGGRIREAMRRGHEVEAMMGTFMHRHNYFM